MLVWALICSLRTDLDRPVENPLCVFRSGTNAAGNLDMHV